MTSRLIGERGGRLVGCGLENTLRSRKGIRRRALTDLCLFVRWTLPPRSREVRILYRIVGLSHPEYIVTERGEVKIQGRATPTR